MKKYKITLFIAGLTMIVQGLSFHEFPINFWIGFGMAIVVLVIVEHNSL